MKYINFERYKFFTIRKYLNIKRYNFSKIYKFIDINRYDFKKVIKYPDFRKVIKYLNFGKVIKYLDFRKVIKYLDFRKVIKYLDFRRYDFFKINKKISFKNYKYLTIYLIFAVIFLGFIYVIIPTFYIYDKSNIEKTVCKNKNIECLIRGKVKYSFYPTPRIKIKDLIINDFFEKKNTLIAVEDTAIKLSIKNLLTKKKQNFKEIELNNFEINFDLENLKKYKNIFKKKVNFIPVTFKKGQIVFLDKKHYVATINDADINLKFVEDSIKAILKGRFLNDNIYVNLNSKKINNKVFTDFILKMSDLNLVTKANFFNSDKKNTTSGNILIRKNKNRITAIFDYQNNEIIIVKSNVKNNFLDGKLNGKVKFLPYFNFNLDLNLNSINFTKLYNLFLSLDEKNQKNLFNINNKINGKFSFSADKIYSNYNLIKSFESRIKFNNGSILIEQFLINLGKLGAADILGTINNDKKFTNFKFESNIFVDNQKKFLSKFGIYNKKNIPTNLFISGNFDLQNIRSSFYEISDNEKFSNDDVNFIEQEFNDIMLEGGYESLFRFPKFKDLIKSITNETN